MGKYPVCGKCGHTLDPAVEDGCDRYALVNEEIYCEFCLKDFLRDEVDDDPFQIAEDLGIPVCQTMTGGDTV